MGASKSDIFDIFVQQGWKTGPKWDSVYANVRNNLMHHVEIKTRGKARKSKRWIHIDYHEPDDEEVMLLSSIDEATKNNGIVNIERGIDFKDFFIRYEEGSRIKIKGLMYDEGIGTPTFRINCPERHISAMKFFFTLDDSDKYHILSKVLTELHNNENTRNMVAEWIAEAKTPSQLFVAFISILNVLSGFQNQPSYNDFISE